MMRLQRNRLATLAGVLVGAVALSSCEGFLTGPGLTRNPNQPTEATLQAMFIAMQARQFTLQEGQLARTASIWTQQMSGVFNQQKEYGSQYSMSENDVQGFYAGFYIGGGLLDLRNIRTKAIEVGDARLEAIAKVWEAFSIGTAASLFGDLIYREAVNFEQYPLPQLDPQEQVYADVQALLTAAITQLQGSAPSPLGSRDLVYGGDRDRWIRAAWTLKARFHLHTAPRLGNAAYTAARDAALNGINEAPTTLQGAMHGQAPGDFRSVHGTTNNVDANIWAQFIRNRTDIVASQRIVGVLQARGDPRLDQFFNPASDGVFRGANQFGTGPDPWSALDLDNRMELDFRQPFITWMENKLILAEAEFMLDNEPVARQHVNDVRATLGLADLPSVTLEQIMVEKWIAQYQNIDVFSDYRRTCYPRLTPGGPNDPTPAARVPGRYPYGGNERRSNPNVPPPSEQPADNWATAPTAASCPAYNPATDI